MRRLIIFANILLLNLISLFSFLSHLKVVAYLDLIHGYLDWREPPQCIIAARILSLLAIASLFLPFHKFMAFINGRSIYFFDSFIFILFFYFSPFLPSLYFGIVATHPLFYLFIFLVMNSEQ